MKSNGKTYWVLLAAIAGLPLMASSALAQQRVGSDGHALDANNRIGSGGINVVNVMPMPSPNNSIVTDNTTGLYGFHGRVGYTSPNSLLINRNDLAGGGIDRFIGASSGVPGAGTAANYNIGPQVYYPASSTAVPPPGFMANNLNSGFVPEHTIPSGVEDLRLGQQPLNSSITTLPLPGELMLPGPVDPNAQRTMIQASPLYGVREWQTNAQGDLFNSQSPTGPDETALANQNRILEIRRQLNQSIVPDNNGASMSDNGSGAINNQAKPLNPTVSLSGQPLTPLGNSNNAGVTSSSLSPGAGNVSTGQTNRSYLPPLPTPAQQSTQYLELRQRLMQYDPNAAANDEQANRAFNNTLRQMRLLQQEQAGLVKPGAVDNNNPGATPAKNIPAGNTSAAHPLAIPSIAKGMHSSALADLLTQAEDQIRRQQFDKAINSYNQAIAAAPNNPLILIGRANAELAGSYYKEAASDIRAALTQDKALLMAEFNLNDLFGAARFEYVVSQLKQVASDSPKDSTPLFLLAYLSYNADSPAKALAYLDGANQRSGGNDPVIALMKSYWSLNEKAPATQPAAK